MKIRKDLPDKQWTRAIYVLITKFHWTMTEIKQLPLSTFKEITELIIWEQKLNEKEVKQHGR